MTLAQQILDLDAHFMRNAFSLVDAQLETVGKYMEHDFKIEGDSAFVDDWEYLHGIGFVTAQKYLTSSCRVLRMEKDKGKAFAIGPKINSSISCAAVVNAAANHWKHADEWDFNNLSGQAKGTIETLNKAGVQVPEYGGYVASEVFQKLGIEKFTDLTPILKQWTDAVETTFPQ